MCELPRRSLLLLAVIGCVLCDGCAATGGHRSRGVPTCGSKPLWLVSNGFHSAIGMRMIDAGGLRDTSPDPAARWLLIGWGSADFFMAKRVTPQIFLRAMLVPGPSALHVVPLRKAIPAALPHTEVFEFDVEPRRFAAARRVMEGAFARDAHGEALSLGPGYFETSAFYLGRERFCLPKTSNVWTAGVLDRAGVSVCPALAISARGLGLAGAWPRAATRALLASG